MRKTITKKLKRNTFEEFNKTIEEMEKQGYVLAFAHKDTLVFKYVGAEGIKEIRERFLELLRWWKG